ncbi:unnamed protein product [Lymnaea stagnalis]|uniref:Uncharacterized protein n=1 Tax=Lymnaea stagnalis TaxID=6523 RepID=A0AAV2H6W1_LYMST
MISYNRLSHLPCEISQCYRLEQLDVSGNQLTYLPATLLFRQGQLAIKTLGNDFIHKEDVPRQWPALSSIISNGQNQPPSLWLLSRASVDRWGLDTGQLPLPIQEELSNASSCFHCGKKNITSSVGLVRFSQFNQKPLPQGSSGEDEYPFLYTFCSMHLQSCTQDTLEQRVDHLSQPL